MHWRIKGLVQKILGGMPGGEALHFQLQTRLGGLRNFDRELDIKVDDWSIMARHLRDAGLLFDGCRLVEIGTGWYPTFPFACHLAGAACVETFDLNPHLKPELVTRCIESLERHLLVIATTSDSSLESVERRWRALRAGWQANHDLQRASNGGIRYHAPADAAATGLDTGNYDAVFSNSVLEHVLPSVIAPLYREALRILRPGGLMFHSVNCGDHYAYVDRDIHQLHYLRYSDAQWKFWDNDFLYQNRLRADHFVDVACDSGFDIVLDTSNVRKERLAQLRAMRLAPEFSGMDAGRLSITSVDFIGRKQGL